MNSRVKQAVEWAALMRAAQDGDLAANNRLLREIAPAIRRMVGNRMPSPADAEDVVQDVLLSVYTVRHTYDPDRPFLPWLMAIVRHRALDRLRRIGRRAAHETVVADWPETCSEAEAKTPENALAATAALERAIANLPPGQRRAIELLKLKEMSLKDAAVITGMSIGALKVATHRAIKALRVAMQKEP